METPQRSSDVDFNDVFGGPPRRADSFDLSFTSSSLRKPQSRDELQSQLLYRSRWSGLGEKPVFGEAAGIASPLRRRRQPHLGDDFFNDIFQGSDPPRNHGFGFFPSTPSLSPARSRVLSPAAASPLQRRLENVATRLSTLDHSASSSPSHRNVKFEDLSHDLFDSIPSESVSMPICARHGSITAEEKRKDLQGSNRQSPLSWQIMQNRSMEAATNAHHKMESKSSKEPSSLQGYWTSGFHFSIYKWAGKGATLVMPSDSKYKSFNGIKSRRVPELVLEVTDIPSADDFVREGTAAQKVQSEMLRNKMGNFSEDRKSESYAAPVENMEAVSLGFKFLERDASEVSGTDLKPPSITSSNSCEELMCKNTIGEVSFSMQGDCRPVLKNLRELLDDELEKPVGHLGTISQNQESEGSFHNFTSTYGDSLNEEQPRSNHVKSVIPSIQEQRDTLASMDDKLAGRKKKGKVREFIKIFNQEVPLDTKGFNRTHETKARREDEKKNKVVGQAGSLHTETIEALRGRSTKDNSTLEDTLIAEYQTSEKPMEPALNPSPEVTVISDFPMRRNDSLHQFPGSTPESLDSLVGDVESSHVDELDGCVVEKLSYEQNEIQMKLLQEEIKTSDNKIREWSKGKEGNIRALLSTLQYVLWPDSGWKPVRLVDIVEGSSVKKAYQKALLFLHPDKLQQKCASTQQKHIAEKVFDILQEAWDHFNCSSSI